MRSSIAVLMLLTLAPGPARGQTWVLKVPGPGLGNPLAVNPLDDNVLYGAAGSAIIHVSRDRGFNWSVLGSPVAGGGIVKSVSVNSADTLEILAGVETSSADPDRIMKSTDGGLTWAETWAGTFSYYGQPVEYSPSHPDTVYTMGLDTLWRSVDFGSTWDTVCAGRGFNAWCDAAIRPDSASVMYLGDNLSGIWKTRDHGASWRKVYSTLGEIPSIAVDPFAANVAYAGKFGGGGGLVKSTDWGETWHPLTVPSGNRDAWWVTCSPVHPGYVYYGTYTGDTAYSGIYVSRDAGASWSRIDAGLPSGASFNYGLLAVDSLTVLALQSNGIYKYQYPVGVRVVSPNGGEVLVEDSTAAIRWEAAGIYTVRIDYSIDGGLTWAAIADSVPAGAGQYAWLVPGAVSTACLVRVSDALFTTAADESDGTFTIAAATITLLSPNGGEAWDAGSVRRVRWAAATADTLEVGFSSDGGASWRTLTRELAAAGGLDWTVPDDPTAAALLRVRSTRDTSAGDASDSVFTILSPAEWSAGIAFVDGGGGRDTIAFGNAAGATDGIDTAFGEAELPPPVPGALDVRWAIDGTNGSRTDYRDTLAPPGGLHRFLAVLQPGPGGYPLDVSWAPDSLRAGTFVLRDAGTGGDRLNVNMRRDSGVVVASGEPQGIEIVQCEGSTVVVPGDGSWRLVSVPVETGDRRATSLFPQAWSGAFAYLAGYEKRDTLRPGEGYWVRTERAELTGCPAAIGNLRVHSGWNMVGAPPGAVAVSQLGSSPESLVVSPFYRYGPAGYTFADSLIPGEGYWVKCRDSGAIVVSPPPGTPGIANQFHRRPAVSLRVTAGRGTSTFYCGPGDAPGRLDEPPSPPPEDPHEVLKTGQLGVFHPASLNYPIEYEIPLRQAENKIFFSWQVEIQENFDYILVEKAGTQEVSATRLSGDGGIEVTPPPSSKYFLRVLPRGIGSDVTPRAYAIGGWYPNPFNPTTRVVLTVPSECRVSYNVYNLLGEVVSTSAIRDVSAGEHHLEWSAVRNDGTPLGSGVYFIVVTASPAGGRAGGDARDFRAVGRVVLVR